MCGNQPRVQLVSHRLNVNYFMSSVCPVHPVKQHEATLAPFDKDKHPSQPNSVNSSFLLQACFKSKYIKTQMKNYYISLYISIIFFIVFFTRAESKRKDEVMVMWHNVFFLVFM